MITTEDGCELWATVTGDGPPVILCHGGPGLWDMLADLAVLLAPTMTVIRWDQRGCGRSARRGPYTLARTVADLDVVRAHFGFDRAAVFGHSWGASVALRYALDHPGRVDRLVYCSGVGIGRAWHASYERNLAARLGSDLARWSALSDRDRTPEEDRELAILQWTADFADPATARAHAQHMATPWFGINHECNTTMDKYDDEAVLIEQCRGMTVPTLIVDGARDIRPSWAVDSLERALPSAARVTMDVGHVPWLEAPDRTRDALLAFLTGCPQRHGNSLDPRLKID